MTSLISPAVSRRSALQAGLALAAAPLVASIGHAADEQPSLARELGVTTGSFVRHLSPTPQDGKLRLLDLPRIVRNELDMRVIDLMTATLASFDPSYLDQLRSAADQAGCVLTNLKMNQPGLDLGTADAELRRKSLDEYKRTITAAARLGVHWVRPLPGPQRPDLKILAASYRELIDAASPHGISLLIENYGWLSRDASAIPEIIRAVGSGLAAQPDTGNWASNEIRYPGLANAFSLAASCDFKAFKLGPDGSHADYDLKRCFHIGWQAGFRGPWCFEHFHTDLPTLYRELALLRDLLRKWIAEQP